MKGNENKEKRPTAFKGVDTLFEDAAPKQKPVTPAPGEKMQDELATVALAALHAFPDHPYTVDEADNDMAELVDSIQREGLLERIVVQRRKEGGFEILSGHRRHCACQILGINEVPVLIKNSLSKDQAILLMVDANLKRKNILPMDEAKALKMQMDAMNRMGQRSTHGKVKRTDEVIAEKISKNRMYVQRKVKLLELTPKLQEAVNNKTLSETPAFEIAYLPKEVQAIFYDWMTFEDRAPTVAQAISARQHQQELAKTGNSKEKDRLLTEEQIDRIMDGERLAEIFPPPPEPKKEEVTKQEGTAGVQPPAAGEKGGGPANPAALAGHVPAQGEPGGEAQPSSAAASAKAIPFQAPGTQNPEASRSSYNSAAPAPAPAATPAQPPPTADAMKSYIRTEYMAELRKENVILPKSEVKGLVPSYSTNDEYVAAIRALFEKENERLLAPKEIEGKDAQAKPAQEKTVQSDKSPVPPVTTPPPKMPEPPRVGTTPTQPVSKQSEPAKVGTPATAAVPKPADAPKMSAPLMPKPAEPPKPNTAPPPKAPDVPKGDASTITTLPKPPEPPKVSAPTATAPTKAAVPEAVGNNHVSTVAKPGFAEKGSGTKALDDFLKNKAKPGIGKSQQGKKPDKAK